MDSASGESVRSARTNTPGKAQQHGPLQARLSSSEHVDSDPIEENPPVTQDARNHHETKINPSATERTSEDSPDGPSPSDPLQPLGALPPSTGLVGDLRHLAESLLGMADTLEKLDSLVHFNRRASTPLYEAPPGQISQLIKGRPDLQQLLRDYLFR
jgi:hypothetical protein